MPHQLVLKYLSSKANFVFNQTLFTLFREREICRYDTFKLLLKTLLKELFANKGEILSCKSVKPCKTRKNSRTYYTRTRDKSGSNSPPCHGNVQIPPSSDTMYSQMPGVCPGGMLKLQFDRYVSRSFAIDNIVKFSTKEAE